MLLEECALVDRNNAPNNLLNVTFDIHYSVHRHCFNTEHLSSPPVFSGVRVSGSLVLCVYFVDRCLSFCTFLFCHCVVCSSSIYGFWLSGVWCLKTLLEVIHRQYTCHTKCTQAHTHSFILFWSNSYTIQNAAPSAPKHSFNTRLK